MNKINILISSNQDYLFATLVLLESIFQNNIFTKIDIHLMYQEINKEGLLKIEEKCKEYEQILFIYKIETGYFDNLSDGIKNVNSLPNEAYFRLLMGDMLPKNIKKILYLDTDILVCGNLLDFYQLVLDDNIIAACEDFGFYIRNDIKKQVYSNLKFNKEYRYFNSGVLLINLEKFRKLYSTSAIMDFMKNTKLILLYGDQCCMNYLLQGKVKYLDADIYNCRPFHYPDNKKSKKEIIQKALILHYGLKPWNEKFDGLGGEVYESYAQNIDCNFYINRVQNKKRLRKIKNNFIIKIKHIQYNLVYSLKYKNGDNWK